MPEKLKEMSKKPNILFIMADDIGWFNVSCYNHGIMGYRTPNIDRIAKEDAMFTDFYGQQSCTAGRASLHSVGAKGSFNWRRRKVVRPMQVLSGLLLPCPIDKRTRWQLGPAVQSAEFPLPGQNTTGTSGESHTSPGKPPALRASPSGGSPC
jgi:Sulfatase